MKTMVYSLLNHIQGNNGRRWAKIIRETGTNHMLLVAIDAAKFTHKAIICTFYGDVLVNPRVHPIPFFHQKEMIG